MLPQDGDFSSTAVITGFAYPVKGPRPEDYLQDWELAGVALNDSSQGRLVKVWHLEGVYNRDEDQVELYLEAPSVPRTFLFAAPNITEVALAFDQNMNPFVAYHEGALAKIYWYDPTLPGMTHTTLPAGIRNMRCTMDERTEKLIGNSDIILCYIRSGNLCLRYQRERYQTEHILRAGVGTSCELVSMARNRGHRMQWRLRNYALTSDPSALIKASPILADVVEQLCIYSKVPRENIDVTDLWDDTVPGLKIDVDEGMDKPMDWLREIFHFDKNISGRKLKWVKRGGQVVARIPYKHLVEGTPTALKQKLADEKKLPRVINVNHLDPDAGHAPNKQTAERRSNLVQSDISKTIESKVVLTVDQAATAAMVILKRYHNELIDYEFATTIRYAELEVTDIIEVEDENGDWHRMRLEAKNDDGKIIEWEGKQDAGNIVYNKKRTGQSLPPPISTTPGLIGETLIEIVDSSPLSEQDDEIGLYIGAAGAPGSTWRGAELLVSLDGGSSYVAAAEFTSPSTIGESTTDLLDEEGYDIESLQTLEVVVNFPLESVTTAQLNTGANRFCVGGEIGQFETAALLGMVGTMYRYTLSGLRRAKYGTKALLWPSGTRFILLDENVIFVRAERNMIGLDLAFKPVSNGKTVDETVPTYYLFTEPASQTEWEPLDVEAERDTVSNDVTVTFTGRPRLGQFGTPFHSKYFRGYRVKFSNDHTIDTMSQTVVYPAAPAGVTVQVCALNEITGEGPYSPAATPVDVTP